MKLDHLPITIPGWLNGESNPASEAVVHRAKWIIVDPWTILENGYLMVMSGIIIDVGTGRPPGDVPCHDHGSMAMMPACVNAHTHLELSALKGRIPLNLGFLSWVKHLLKQRDALDMASFHAGIFSGIQGLFDSGCRLVGDISSLGLTFEPLQEKSMAGVVFREHLGEGGDSEYDLSDQTKYLKSGLAGHAPHTTSPELFQHLKAVSSHSGSPMSIHVSESEEEISFITTGRGTWANFLSQRQIDFSAWPLKARSPVAYLSELGMLDSKTLAVHLLNIDAMDIDLLRHHRVHTCVCPRSNHALHQRIPDLDSMISAGLSPCLGTDSLASTPSLSIFDEMSFVASTYPNLSPATILAMGTVYGAAALGFGDEFGSLHPGHLGAALVIPVDVHHKNNLIETIFDLNLAENI